MVQGRALQKLQSRADTATGCGHGLRGNCLLLPLRLLLLLPSCSI
jgi:hypothetical protein